MFVRKHFCVETVIRYTTYLISKMSQNDFTKNKEQNGARLEFFKIGFRNVGTDVRTRHVSLFLEGTLQYCLVLQHTF